MIKVKIMDSKNEKWYQSRRVWAAGLTAIATIMTVSMPEQTELWIALFGTAATVLGLSSWTFPKNNSGYSIKGINYPLFLINSKSSYRLVYVLVEKKMKKFGKKLALIGAAGLIVGATLGGAILYNPYSDVDMKVAVEKAKIEAFKQGQDSVQPIVINETQIVEKEVEVEVEVPVEKIVEVDNENLALVLDELYLNDGQVDYLVDDLDDDELDLIIDRIFFVRELKELAVKEVEKELFDELDKEEFTFGDVTVEFDEDDLERLRIDDDMDELLVDIQDWEDKDAEITVTGTFEQDDVKYDFSAIVEFKDGEIEDFDIEEVSIHE
jgi:hypothetical protein